MPPMTPEDSLDVRHAAALIGRHPETVRRWVWSGRLPAQRRGNRLLVARADVEALAARDGAAATSLASWAERARAFQASTASSGAGRGAADLVLEDRRLRSGIEADDAGR
jgi:excisionase family DNA binding protein